MTAMTAEPVVERLPRNIILIGDALEQLRQLPAATVDCVITSPPYYGLRDYGVAGQLEVTVDEWVDKLRRVCAELGRVLKPSGALWLNLGDSYSRHVQYGAPTKSLLCAPERLLLALLGDGWLVRNKVVWAKTNPTPASVGDRLNATYDFMYLLVRSRRYYFDLDAIREPHRSYASKSSGPTPRRPAPWAGPLSGNQVGSSRGALSNHPLGKNPGDVWRLTIANYRGAHFATFPPALVERPLLAACPEAICVECGTPRRRPRRSRRLGDSPGTGTPPAKRRDGVDRYPTRWEVVHFVGPLQADCGCEAKTRPGIVLDPFFGAGTVGLVAREHGRDSLGIELNPAYVTLAEERLCLARP
jgi:DNA modification methylase